MSIFTPGAKGPVGLQPRDYDVEVVFTDAVSTGDVCCFDFDDAAANGDVASGTDTSIFSVVRDPVADDFGGLFPRVYGVALQDAGAGEKGNVRVMGRVQALVGTGITVAIGDAMSPLAGTTLKLGLTGERHVAMGMQAIVTSGTELVDVLFDGVSGWMPSTAG